MTHVPLNRPWFTELERQYLTEAFDTGWVTTGPFVERLEEAFARRVGRRHAVACSSGTAALWLALAAGMPPKTRVLTQAYVCDAVANTAFFATGRPPLVGDVAFGEWGLQAAEAERVFEACQGQVDHEPGALVFAHTYGVPTRDTEALVALGKAHDVLVIEDASEAHGAAIGSRPVGSFGDVSVFSARGEKSLSGGQLGLLATDDADLARRARQLLENGLPCRTLRFWSTLPAFNCQPAHLNAALACAQLERLDELVKAREAVHRRWRALFAEVNGVEFQAVYGTPAWWLTGLILYPEFTPLLPQDIATGLAAVGIETRPGFYPLHRLPHCVGANLAGPCPVSDLLLRQLLILPSGPTVTEGQQEYVMRELFRLIGRL